MRSCFRGLKVCPPLGFAHKPWDICAGGFSAHKSGIRQGNESLMHGHVLFTLQGSRHPTLYVRFLYYRPTEILYGGGGGGSKDDQDSGEAFRRSCPNCGQTIQKDLKTCPYCNKAVSIFNDPKIKSDIDKLTKEMEDAIDNAFKTNCLGECQRNAMLRTLSGSSTLGYGQRRVLTSLLGNIIKEKEEKGRRTQAQLLRRYLGMVQLPKEIIAELEGAFQLNHIEKSTELKK